ncbi:MAG: type II toxin-antitoxin system VapC family toxin [Acidobacteria bacterium]|nr:type II toxin-antitoxin system VapC family toxin [Acidobacteriota bacterium]
MVAVDTNVLVRFLVRDDRKQADRAASLIRSASIWISKTVLLETEWVLRSLYGFPPHARVGALRALAGLRTVFVEDELAVAKALDWFQGGLDFADALHLASVGNSEQFATCDRKLAKQGKRLTALETISV